MTMISTKVPVGIGMTICEDLATRGIWPDIHNAEDVLFGTAKEMEIMVPREHLEVLMSLKKAYCG